MTDTPLAERFIAAMAEMPVVAIMRGVRPDEVVAFAQAIFDAGIRVIEVPLNSPDPLRSISLLREYFGEQAIIGAGTVLSAKDVARCHDAGAQIIVSPNMDPDVIESAVAMGMICAPGCLTPTEAFAALKAGAHAIKLFPGELISPAAVKAMRAVLPREAIVLVVGGVSASSIDDYIQVGANGFGVGGSLYRAGASLEEVRTNAEKFVSALQATS